jgi:hypothetical protein
VTEKLPHSVRSVGEITAAGFPRKCHHRHEYGMTCEQFDLLEARADGHCELCGISEADIPFGKLHMDHDHAIGFGAVRGLVCQKCNAHLRRVDSGERSTDDKVTAYLTSPFWHVIYPNEIERYPIRVPSAY